MDLRDRVFADDEALSVIDAAMSAEEIAGDAGYGCEGSGFGAEEFECHETAGYGGVGSSAKDSGEAHRG